MGLGWVGLGCVDGSEERGGSSVRLCVLVVGLFVIHQIGMQKLTLFRFFSIYPFAT